jgi:hypothetical protein
MHLIYHFIILSIFTQTIWWNLSNRCSHMVQNLDQDIQKWTDFVKYLSVILLMAFVTLSVKIPGQNLDLTRLKLGMIWKFHESNSITISSPELNFIQCHFLHSEHHISSSNLRQKIPILDEKIMKTTKHFNNYDTTFSTPLVQHQNTIISLTSERHSLSSSISATRMPLRCISLGSCGFIGFIFYCGQVTDSMFSRPPFSSWLGTGNGRVKSKHIHPITSNSNN